MKQTSTNIQHFLTEQEINELAKELAAEVKNFGEIQNSKKRYNAIAKADLDYSNEKIQKISIKIRDGYYFEEKLCNVEDDYINKQRVYKDPQTGEILKTEPFPDSNNDNIFSSADINEDQDYSMVDPDDDEEEVEMMLLPESNHIEADNG